MKKVISILIPMLLVGILGAVSFQYDGEFRARAAMYNNAVEDDGGHFDNRLQLGMQAELNPDLKLYAKFEVSESALGIVWGNAGGAPGTRGINVKTAEAYIDYRIEAIESNLRVGQMYWKDHRGLVLDDNFSGIFITKDDLFGFKAEFAWMKAMEGARIGNDDYNVLMANLMGESPYPYGLTLMYGDNDGATNITAMPYITLDFDPVNLDLVAFADYQITPGGADDVLGIGGAAKATADLGMFEIGGDLLFATGDGLTTLLPYYQNGLYIYGYGPHHDGVNLYWGDDYSTANASDDAFISAVGNIKAPLNDKMKAFAAGGLVVDEGIEINAGLEYNLIPDLFDMALFGAYGRHENDTNNYMLGSTLKVNF